MKCPVCGETRMLVQYLGAVTCEPCGRRRRPDAPWAYECGGRCGGEDAPAWINRVIRAQRRARIMRRIGAETVEDAALLLRLR